MQIAKELPEELDVTNPLHIEWIKSSRDPLIWHEAAVAALAYMGDKHGFLPWLVEQPELDRATAGWLFLWCAGERYLSGQKDGFYAKIPDDRVLELTKAICWRSENGEFGSARAGLDTSFEETREKCLELISNGQISDGVVAPRTLLSKPFQSQNGIGKYFVSDGMLVNSSFMSGLLGWACPLKVKKAILAR